MPGRPGAGGLVLLAVLVAVAGCVAVDTSGESDRSGRSPATGGPVPTSALAGAWSGEGVLADCAGFDRGCPETLDIELVVDCAAVPCAVTLFDDSYGSPPLRFEDGRYRAAGPVPAAVAPRCGGAPASTALWRLELSVQDGRLTGSYAESTVQSFDCGATFVAHEVVLERG